MFDSEKISYMSCQTTIRSVNNNPNVFEDSLPHFKCIDLKPSSLDFWSDPNELNLERENVIF